MQYFITRFVGNFQAADALKDILSCWIENVKLFKTEQIFE